MDFHDAIRARRSIRYFENTPVEEEKLTRIRDAVRLAPTARNRQPFRFVEVVSTEKRHALCDCYSRDWLQSAPLIIAAVGKPSEAWTRLNGRSICDVDVAIALEHLVLAAAAEGLATCWICAFDQEHAHDALDLPTEETVVALTPLGYGAMAPADIPRKSVEELFARY